MEKVKSLLTVSSKELANVLSEFFATFFLVFMFGTLVLQVTFAEFDISNQPLNQMFSIFGPFVIGLLVALLIMTFSKYGYVHMNPAVSLSLFIKGEEKPAVFLYRVIAQLIAAFIAFWIIGQVFTTELFSFPNYDDIVSSLESLELGTLAIAMVEGLGGLLWTLAVLKTKEKNLGLNFSALIVGLSVVAATFVAMPFSTGLINPLFTVGFEYPAVYVFAPMLGGVIAVLISLLTDAVGGGVSLKFQTTDSSKTEEKKIEKKSASKETKTKNKNKKK